MEPVPFILLLTLVRFLPSFLLFFIVFSKYLKYSKKATVLAFLFVVLIKSLEYYLLKHPLGKFVPQSRLILSILILMMSIVLFHKMINLNIYKLIFALLFINAYSDNIIYISELIIILAYPLHLQHLILNLPHALLSSFLFLFINIAATLPVFYLLVRKVLNPMLDETYPSVYWKYIFIIPIVFYFIFRLVIYPGYSTLTIVASHKSLFLELFWFFSSFLCLFIVLFMLKQSDHTHQLEKKYQLLDMQIEMQKIQYQNMQQAMENFQRYKHDFRHHAIVIHTLLYEKNYKKLESYLQTLPIFQIDDIPCLCENTTIDSILRHYYEFAKNHHIQTSFQVSLSENVPIPANDLCVIFGNLLENAVEACLEIPEQERFIKVICKPYEGILTLHVQNSYDGHLSIEHEHFHSTKHEGKAIGIASVKQIVNKNNGVYKFEYTENTFSVSILLNHKNQFN